MSTNDVVVAGGVVLEIPLPSKEEVEIKRSWGVLIIKPSLKRVIRRFDVSRKTYNILNRYNGEIEIPPELLKIYRVEHLPNGNEVEVEHEYIEGIALHIQSDMCQPLGSAKGVLTVNFEDLVKIGKDIATQLKWMHAHHYYHRDLKLSNIVWNIQTRTARMIDFDSLTFEKDIKTKICEVEIATPNYTPPEMISSLYKVVKLLNMTYLPYIDFFQLGMCLLFLVKESSDLDAGVTRSKVYEYIKTGKLAKQFNNPVFTSSPLIAAFTENVIKRLVSNSKTERAEGFNNLLNWS